MKIAKFSWKEAIIFGWGLMKKNLPFFIGFLIAAFIIKFIPYQLAELFKRRNTAICVTFNLISIFFVILVDMGFIRVVLKVVAKEKPEMFDLFNCYPLFFKYLRAWILYVLMILVGLVFLIVPGIIIAIRASMYGYFIVDKGLGPIEALKQSFKITKGSVWDLFIFSLIIVGINILGFLALVIGLLATIPTTMIAAIFVYRKLLQPEMQPNFGVEPPKV